MYHQPEINFRPEEVLVYLRKSRSDDPLLTVEEVLAKHEAILDEWCERYLGGKVPEENKFREVVSGETIADRPEMCALLRKIESPKYKATLAVEVQRWSRGDLEDAGRLIKLLRHTNTLAITQTRVYDLRDEYDRESFERELKRGNEFLEYQKKIMGRGRLLSVQQGNYIGTVAPYGYDKHTEYEGRKKCPTLKPNPEEADVVRMIFDMYVNQDLGRVTIAKRLNELGVKPRKAKLWAQDAIKGILENEHYIGKVRWNWRKTIAIVEEGEIRKSRPKTEVGEYLVFDGRHDALISEELFAAARAKQGRNHRAKSTTKVRNPLVGLVFCQCGRAMSYRTYLKDGVERAPARLLCDNQSYCKTTSCLYSELLERVIEVLKQCIQDFEIRIKNNDGDSLKLHQNLIKRLEAKKIELEKKEIAQWEAQTDPDPERRMPQHVFKMLNEKLLKEKEEVNQALCQAYESMPNPVDYEEKMLRFKDALDTLQDPNASAQQKNRLLKACIDRIDYKRERAERIPSQQERYYDPEQKRTRHRSSLKTGGNWTNPPIELDVKLRL